MKALYWNEANLGMTFEEKEIPVDMQDLCKKWRDHMIEAAAEANED